MQNAIKNRVQKINLIVKKCNIPSLVIIEKGTNNWVISETYFNGIKGSGKNKTFFCDNYTNYLDKIDKAVAINGVDRPPVIINDLL